MIITCNDRERIFLDGTPEEWAALELHAAICASCRDELHAWKSLSVTASEMREEWNSPALWPRIERELAERSASAKVPWWRRLLGSLNLTSLQWQTAAAALVLFAITSTAVWVGFDRPPADPFAGSLLKDPAVRDVEKKEAAYEEAIDKLDAQVRPQLDKASTPLMASYR